MVARKTIKNIVQKVIFCLAFVLGAWLHVHAQQKVKITIKKGESAATVLNNAKSKLDVLIAYSFSLDQVYSHFSKTLEASNSADLMKKICASFQLDYIKSDQNSFLVRTQANDIDNSDDIVIHLRLRDEYDQSPLAFAAVYDPESMQYFAFSDDEGDCFITIPKSFEGKELKIHSLAHTDQHIQINKSKSYQEIVMTHDPVKNMPVTIQSMKAKLAFNKDQAISMDHVDLGKLNLSSIFVNDVNRAVQHLPGVNATNDSNASIRIRGSAEEATLLVIDDMPVYKADHFYGLFGAFNNQYIQKIALYRNNLPIEYGGRTSGMLKLTSNNQIEKFRGYVDINLLSSGVNFVIPISKEIGFKFAGRKTYTNLTKTKYYDLSQRNNLETDNKVGSQIISNPTFDFYDLNAKLFMNVKRHHFDFNVFQSSDEFIDRYDIMYSGPQSKTNLESFDQKSNWNNTSFGLNHEFKGQNINVYTNVYMTHFTSNYDISSSLAETKMNSTTIDSITINNYNEISDKGVKSTINIKSIKALKFGLEYIIHDNDVEIQSDRNVILKEDKEGIESSFFGQYDFGNKASTLFQTGLRTTYIPALQQIFLLPQLYFSKSLQPNWIIKSSFGQQLQYVRQFEHENKLGQKQSYFGLSDENIPLGKSTNTMIGTWKSYDGYTFDVEAYYRTLDGAIMHATQKPGPRDKPDNGTNEVAFKLFQGDSRVYGIDMSFVFEKYKGWYSMANYTLSKAENRFSEIFNNRYFPSSEDSRHQFKWINVFAYKKFDFSFSYIGATGRPYLDLSNLNNNIDRSHLQITKYIKKLPNYHRFDVGTSYNINYKKQVIKFGISVFNVLNRSNVKYKQFVFQYQKPNGGPGNPASNIILGSDVTQLDRTFNVSVAFIFQ